jgi:hypothetical protein
MKVDSDKIIQETIEVFEKSGAVNFYKKCKDLVGDEDYKRLHPQFLTPLDIKIDCNLFNKEILKYEEYFEQWGNDHQHLPRYGLALVNQDGKLKNKDPVNGSLMAWNRDNPSQPLIETDCTVPTDVMTMPSLSPLNILNGHWCRSNIFKWNKDAFFFPHIDTIVPSMWIRLWAVTTPGIVVRYYNKNTDSFEVVENIELGRVYIIDTSLVHDANAINDNIYQLFLSILPSAKGILLKHTAN